MANYLKERFCTGLPPLRVARSVLYERNSLISTMMLERGRPKLLCAPSMMGKTSLAFQYAQVAHSFNNVFWLDAHHPYVLKCLDSESLTKELLQISPDGGMVVFEDVPLLDEGRQREFLSACDRLIDAGKEVVVTCIPRNDPFSKSCSTCLRIDSDDLLFVDEEFEGLRLHGYLPGDYSLPSCKMERIPGLLNRPSGCVQRFMSAQIAESIDEYDSMLTFALVLLGVGSFQDLSYVMGKDISPDDLRVQDDRPYASIVNFGRHFSADGFPVGEVLRSMNAHMTSIASNVSDIDVNLFMGRIADVLFSHGMLDKAARVVMESCDSAYRAEWIDRHADELIERCAPMHVALICRGLQEVGLDKNDSLKFHEAYALMLLGETKASTKALIELAGDCEVGLCLRLRCAALASLQCDGHPSSVNFGGSFDAACMAARKKSDAGLPLLDLWNALLEGDSGISCTQDALRKRDRSPGWPLAVACCLRGLRESVIEMDLDPDDAVLIPGLIDSARDAIEEAIRSNAFESSLFLAKREIDSFRTTKSWSRGAMALFDQIESKLRSQNVSFKKLSSPAPQESLPFLSGMSKSLLPKLQSDSVMSVPVLDIRMFGRFEALIGGEPVDRKKISRLKCRSLLTLLALDAGKDLSCERLGEMLWRESAPNKAKRNFYSIFSMLRRALLLPDGTCPYLSRSQGVCRLNSLYLRSDAEEVLELCQQLRFGRPSPEDAFAMLERLKEVYQGELLPGEKSIPVIESARMTWRNKVVDALLIATRSLRDQGESVMALDFAQFALKCDTQRDDVYEILMILQYERKQRAGAIETFLAYQQVNKDLGIDSSDRMTELYEGILNDNLDDSQLLSGMIL